MLKRCLAVSLMAVALVVSVGMHQLRAECILVVGCTVTPNGSVCEEIFMC